MTAKPTAVFVRLPLSEDDCGLLIDASSFGAPDDSHDKALIAIGTPVAGGELEVVGMRTRDIRSIFTSIWHYSGDIESSGNYETELLVRQSDAQAALAAAHVDIARKDDEIDRLWAALENIEVSIDALPDDMEDYSKMNAREMRRQALEVVKDEVKTLKGQEA
ncbi:hypothetical protein [Acetobacter sp. P5B1]|uniref:hypothetical protein n=1 Tax=Acetobacter sp. P5B1 TaxID=2762620 RepID=UPI001C055F55|nr:hypothetical protein [Acetobacter sp. P5B1]